MRQNMEELTATQEEMSRKEAEYVQQIRDLEENLSKQAPGDDWAEVQNLEKTLRINLEALRITQEQARN